MSHVVIDVRVVAKYACSSRNEACGDDPQAGAPIVAPAPPAPVPASITPQAGTNDGAVATPPRAPVPAAVTAASATPKPAATPGARRGTFLSYLLWMCFVPVVLALGVRDRISAGITGGCVILAALLSWLAATRRVGGPIRFIVYCLGTLAIASTCTLLGWAVVVPGLAAVHTVGFMLYGEKKWQPAALVLGVLAVMVPFVLQEAGVLPRAYL